MQTRKHISIFAMFNLKEFEKSSQTMQRRMRKSARRLKSVGQSMSKSISAPIALGLGFAVKEFAEFEQSMARVSAVSGATISEMGKLTKLAEDLGRTTRFTASEVSNLELNYAKLGFSSREIEEITEATLDLALATGSDLSNSAMVAGATLRGFGLDGSEMQRVVDVMAKSFTSSALDLEKFSVSISKIAPIAAVTGRTIEEVAAQQSVLADTGVEASIIGTSLRKIYGDLAKSGMSYNEAMDKIRSSTNKVATATKLFDIRAANAAIILSEQEDKVLRLTKAYLSAEGAAKSMAKIMNDTLQMSFKRLQSAISGLGIKVGKELAPLLEKLGEKIIALTQYFSNLDAPTRKFYLLIIGFAAIMPPIILLFGSLAVAVTALGSAAAGFVAVALPVIGVVSALAVGFKWLEHWVRKNKDSFTNSQSYLDKLSTAMQQHKDIIDLVNGAKKKGIKLTEEEQDNMLNKAIIDRKAMRAIIEDLKLRKRRMQLMLKERLLSLNYGPQSASQAEHQGVRLAKMAGLNDEIKKLSSDIGDLDTKSKEALAAIGELSRMRDKKPSALKSPLGGDVILDDDAADEKFKKWKKKQEELVKKIQDVNRNTAKGLTIKVNNLGLFESFNSNFTSNMFSKMQVRKAFKDYKTEVENGAAEVYEALKGVQIKVEQKFNAITTSINLAIQGIAQDAVYGIADLFGQMAASGDDFNKEDFGKGVLEMVASFMQQLGGLMITWGISFEAFQKSILAGPAGPAIAIAAGVAMVAAGAAIKGTLSKGLDGGSSVTSPSSYGSTSGGVSFGNQDIVSTVRIEGREMIITQKRENNFRR